MIEPLLRFYKLAGLAVIAGVGLLFLIFDPSANSFYPQCPFFLLTGHYCPGCGSQRAFYSLLHFDFTGALRNNFLFIPAILFIIYHYLYPLMNSNFGLNLPNLIYMKATPRAVLIIIIVFWILRNIPFPPFTLLTPQ